MFSEPIGATYHLAETFHVRTPAEPMPPPIKEPVEPPENPDAPVREPESDPLGTPQI